MDTADYINRNLSTMSRDEKIAICSRFITDISLNEILLKHELDNLTPPQITSFSAYVDIANNFLTRYTKKAGGFNLEDEEWRKHDTSGFKYQLRDNEIIFDNSISAEHRMDTDVYLFLRSIAGDNGILNKMNPRYKASFRYINDDANCISWIIIKLREKIE